MPFVIDVRNRIVRYILAALMSVLCVAHTGAVPITYTEIGTISGSLNGVAFVDAVITITGSGDTNNITHGQPCCFGNRLGVSTVTFDLAGFGTGTFTDLVGVNVNQVNVGAGGLDTFMSGAGFSDFTSNLLILWTLDPAFASWDLSTDIGPLTGPGFCNCDQLFVFNISFPTTLGLLHISASDPTFTADAASVPLPATLPLVVAAFGAWGLLGWCWKRKGAAIAWFE